jgi:hypothetical protein
LKDSKNGRLRGRKFRKHVPKYLFKGKKERLGGRKKHGE